MRLEATTFAIPPTFRRVGCSTLPRQALCALRARAEADGMAR
jgi:hypothetical protein